MLYIPTPTVASPTPIPTDIENPISVFITEAKKGMRELYVRQCCAMCTLCALHSAHVIIQYPIQYTVYIIQCTMYSKASIYFPPKTFGDKSPELLGR